MMKLTGCILVMMAFWFLGRKFANFKRKRLCFLEKMRLSVANFKAAVDVFSVPVPDALGKSGLEREGLVFFSEDDERDYSNFLMGTKAETKEGQMLNAEAYLSKIEREEKEERAKYSNEARLIKGGTLLMGILLVLLLL